MAALMPEGPGAQPHTVAKEEEQRLRVRLHFGGTFAQDGPHQWRYVGGEVYNESFPLTCEYHVVSKRLNDKFGDTVSFKYLCPGDELDPDNLVQVQGDDDLREMCDEYEAALKKCSSVKTLRIRVFVFRAVIFEREVQELDEELVGEDEDMDDDGCDGLYSSDPEECGPNWDEWGDPGEQEATDSSLPSAHPSSDAELHNGTAVASAAAAATAALRNINVSNNSQANGATGAHVPRAPLSAVAAAWGAARLGIDGSSSGHGGNPTHGRFGHIPAARLGTATAAGGVCGHPADDVTEALGTQAEVGVYACDGLDTVMVQQCQDPEDYGEAHGCLGMQELHQQPPCTGQRHGAFALGVGPSADPFDKKFYMGMAHRIPAPNNVHASIQAFLRQQEHQTEANRLRRREAAEGQQRRLAHEEWLVERELEQELGQQLAETRRDEQHREQQQLLLQQQQQARPQQWPEQGRLPETGAGFYCDEELEDPYGEQCGELASDGGRQARADPTAACRGGKMASGDGGLGAPSTADAAVGQGQRKSGPSDKEMQKNGSRGGLAARPPTAADMLPRHISIFGESSRDDSLGGGPGGVGGTELGLPSRITIFGDDDAPSGKPGGGAGSSVGGQRAAGDCGGGLHRLAVPGIAGGPGAAGTRWPALGAPLGGEPSIHLHLDLVAGDSRQCITQDFGLQQHSSILDVEEHQAGGGGEGGRASPFDPLEMLSMGGARAGGLNALDSLSSAEHHNHPLRGVVKKRKSEVCILAKIGEGAFGEVSQAQVFPYGIVAIKWLKRERFAKYSESFQREAEMLARLNHPNIIRMYGLVMDSPESPSYGGAPPHSGESGDSGGALAGGGGGASGAGTPTGLIGGIITEFVRNGSLGQYLRALHGRRLSLRQRAMIALQAALGMAYLHEQSPAVVHFDLKPDNLLVDGEGDSMVIKVADFGLSKHKLSNYVSCRDLRGTLPYMAYELVSGNGNISEKVDVYSMGVVMWEMYTGEVPFAHLPAQEILTGLLHGNLHLAIPPACEPEWRSLVETCMDFNPANRPSFQELAMQLQEILRLERQTSNASSVSGAAAAAAAAALRDSSGGAAAAAAAAAAEAALPGDSAGGGAGAGSGGAQAPGAEVTKAAGAAPQWQVPAPLQALPAAAQPQVRHHALPSVHMHPPPPQPRLPSPHQLLQPAPRIQQPHPGQQLQPPSQPTPVQVPMPPQPLIARQLQVPPPPPQRLQPPAVAMPPPSAALAQLAQQHAGRPPPAQLQQPQHPHQHPVQPYQVQQPFANVQYGAPQPAPSPLLQQHQQQQATAPRPQQQGLQHHLPFAPSVPAPPPLVLPLPANLLAQQQQPHYAAVQLRPQAIFPPPPPQQQPLAQHANGLYGLIGAGGAGMPPLVSWGDRGM